MDISFPPNFGWVVLLLALGGLLAVMGIAFLLNAVFRVWYACFGELLIFAAGIAPTVLRLTVIPAGLMVLVVAYIGYSGDRIANSQVLIDSARRGAFRIGGVLLAVSAMCGGIAWALLRAGRAL